MVFEATPEIWFESDFKKADTRNTKSFGTFSSTEPRCFIDNHVSNGADYQYKITYIMTQQKTS
jgi:hypothetical protein